MRAAQDQGSALPVRVALLSMHTCPLEQPGTGDSGGMNVYVRSLAAALARQGMTCDVFTRRAHSEAPKVVVSEPGVRVYHIDAGPADAVSKAELTLLLPGFLAGVREVSDNCGRPYDIIHSHYWLSAWAGRALAALWGVPLVHTFHTLAKAKNGSLGPGEEPEPPVRIAGETKAIAAASAMIVSSRAEAAFLASEYGADPERVRVIPPGVDHRLFSHGAHRAEAAAIRDALAGPGGSMLLVAGRIQPLKGIDIAIEALAHLGQSAPADSPPVTLVVLGGPSGPAGEREVVRLHELARARGVADRVVFCDPVPQSGLGAWYEAADAVLMPSRSESFGLVALEAQASGTPVIASAVGGLPEVIADEETGILVEAPAPETFARAITSLLGDPERRARMAHGAAARAEGFSWQMTAARTIDVYRAARESFSMYGAPGEAAPPPAAAVCGLGQGVCR